MKDIKSVKVVKEREEKTPRNAQPARATV